MFAVATAAILATMLMALVRAFRGPTSGPDPGRVGRGWNFFDRRPGIGVCAVDGEGAEELASARARRE